MRLWFLAVDANGAHFFVDSVDFAGTASEYEGGVPVVPTIARQVATPRISVVYDAANKTINEVRKTRLESGVLLATGENILAEATPLYSASLRSSLSDLSPSVEDSTGHDLVVERITQSGQSGWRVSRNPVADPDLGVVVDIYSEPGGDAIYFEPTVTRPQTRLLEKVTCPMLTASADFPAGSNGSHLLLPRGGGMLLRLDAAFFSDLQNDKYVLDAEYPGLASVQLLALYGSDFGLALAAFEEAGENKLVSAVVDGADRSCDLSIQHRLPSVLPGLPESSVVTFKRALLACEGSWMDAAEGYRDWVRTTDLWGRAVTKAADTASWVQGRPVVVEAELRPLGIGSELVKLVDWASVLVAWSNHLGPEVIPLFRHFEKNGTYIGPDYLPMNVLGVDANGNYPILHNQANILASWSSVEMTGSHPMAMIASLNWAADSAVGPSRGGVPPAYDPVTMACTTTGGNSRHRWHYRYSSGTTSSPWDGIVVKDRPTPTSPAVNRYSPSGSASWQYGYYVMDPRDSYAIQVHEDVAETMASGGLRLYEFDQMLGGGVPDNFDPLRPSLGAGAWKAAAIRGLYSNTLAAGRGEEPDFELSMEFPCEQYIDIVSVPIVKPSIMMRFPAVGSKVGSNSGLSECGFSETVPLFQYIFNEVAWFSTADQWMPTAWHSQQNAQWSSWSGPSNPMTRAEHRQHHLVNMARVLTSGSWMAIGLEPYQLMNEVLPSGCSTNATGMEPMPTKMEGEIGPFFEACVGTSFGPANTFLNSAYMVRMSGFDDHGAIIPQVWVNTQTGAEKVDLPRVYSCALEMGSTGPWGLLLVNADRASSAVVDLPTAIGVRQMAANDPINVYVDGVQQAAISYSPGVPYTVQPRSVVFLVYQ